MAEEKKEVHVHQIKSDPNKVRMYYLTKEMVEKITKDKITAFLDKFRLILNTQHGFRNNRSCLTNLLEFFNYIFSNYDERIPSDIIYLDFRRLSIQYHMNVF